MKPTNTKDRQNLRQALHMQRVERASKHTKTVETEDRRSTILAIMRGLLLNELTQGQALKRLRIEITGLKQDEYAKLVGVSRKTLSDVENDRGNMTTVLLDKLFKPFGLKAGIVPIHANTFTALFGEVEKRE